MNTSQTFMLPEDGWYHIAAYGEWPHKPTGLTQVIDPESADEIIRSFTEFQAAPNWPGVLIDFDHQSLDADKPTVAAGWIVDLQKRDNGLWGRVRWSDLGRTSIEGGRYRFISPVWRHSDCAKLDDVRIRPLKLMNCAVTNDPNIRGLFPLSNASGKDPQTLSAPPMVIWPHAPKQEFASSPAIPSPEQAKPVTIPAHFLTALVANRTNWTPAETRKRYRFGQQMIANWGGQRPRTEEERKAMFAKLRASNPHARKVDTLYEQRRILQGLLTDAPAEFEGFAPVNVREAIQRAAKQPGATPQDIRQAEEHAKALNFQRRQQLSKLKKHFKKSYKSKEAAERAFHRHVAALERQSHEQITAWANNQADIKTKISEINLEIARQEDLAKDYDAKLKRQELMEQQKAKAWEERAEKERQQAEKAKQQAELAALRAAQAEAERPLKEAAREARKPALFWKLVSQGNKQAALQVYPHADYAEALKEYNDITRKITSQRDKTTQNEMKRQFANTPPPQIHIQ